MLVNKRLTKTHTHTARPGTWLAKEYESFLYVQGIVDGHDQTHKVHRIT